MGLIRFNLALLVLVSHAGLASESLSRTAVGLFFVLSGYLMQLTLSVNYGQVSSGPRLGDYYLNRFLRIFPLYWIILVFVAIFFPEYFWDKSQDPLLVVFLLEHRIAGSVIGPAWTLPYEITYFALAPLFLLLGLKLAITVSVLAVLVNLDFKISELSLLINPFAWGVSGSTVVAQAILLFALGASAYHLNSSKFSIRVLRILFNMVSSIFTFSVVIVLASNWYLSRETAFDFWESNSWSVNLGAVVLLIVALFSWNKGESRIGKITGQLTYPIYLLHWPLIQLVLPNTEFASLLREVAKRFYLADYLMLTIAVTLISTIIGLCWLQIEKVLILRRRRTGTGGSLN